MRIPHAASTELQLRLISENTSTTLPLPKKKVKGDHRSKFFQFKQLEGTSLKNIRASTGFEPVTSARLPRSRRSRVRQPQNNMNFI